MARAIWSGAVTFGLVSIPVKLHAAVVQKEVRFHLLHEKDGSRVRMKRFCEAEDREVAWDEIVKGFEVSRGRYVAITPEELEQRAAKATRTIDIRDFVELADIDPIYYDATYYLVPERTAAKAYRLLLEAMRRTGRVAIGTFVLRTREALCCIRPREDALALSTMSRADEVVSVSALEVPAAAKPAERELAMAEQLVTSLSSPFEPERYPDEYRERVLELVRAKAEGETLEAPEPKAAPAKVVSLADALSASLAAARERGDGADRQRPPARGARQHRPAAAARAARSPRKPRRRKRG
jgi:DNA end-binding protein Ku